jgi:Protein of unknown function (DUF3050)
MLDWTELDALRARLNAHPVYGSLRRIEDLRLFMQHHIYSVWDFMSLIKFIQGAVAPVNVPWLPAGDAAVRRFINELVMEEESDEAPACLGGGSHTSHVELYCRGMKEVGADNSGFLHFISRVKGEGIQAALADEAVPAPSRRFTQTTFEFIDSGKPHVAAAALAHGREHVIPNMFRAFLREMHVSENDAPVFHYYLNRHIHLDEDFHAPLSLRLIEELVDGDPEKEQDARDAASAAITARLAFWDGVHAAIEGERA